MTILYVITKFLTFPAAYLKGFWEHVACSALGIRVEYAKYLNTHETCGHVDNDFPEKASKSFWLCFLPGMVNMIFAMPFFLTGIINLFYLGIESTDIQANTEQPFYYIYAAFLIIGCMFLCNIFPMFENAVYMKDKIYNGENVRLIWKILAFIPVYCMYIGAFLERFGITTLLAIAGCAYIFFF